MNGPRLLARPDSAPHPLGGAARAGPGRDVVLIAHGSPDPRHAESIGRTVMRLRGLLGVAVSAAYLEHNAPSAAEALKQSPPAGVRAVVPMLLTAGYHWERDIPAVAAQRGATAILLPPPAPSSFSASVAGLLAGPTDSSGAQKSRVLLASAGSTRPGVVPRFDDLAIGVGAATGTEVLVALSARAVSDLARPGDTVVPVLTGSGFLADRIAAAATAAGARTTAVLGDTDGFARDLAAVIRAALV